MMFLGCKNTLTVAEKKVQTVCNPVNLSYRFRPETDEVSRREAADPTVITFKGEYWLFASKSGGYWHSKDLTHWQFVLSNEIPTEDYAPTAIVLNDTIYLVVSSKKNKKVYQTADPISGKWMVKDSLDMAVEDPCLFQDTDKKLYLYWGCSNVNPLYGSEIDPKTFAFIGEKKELVTANSAEHGWEVRGDYNTQYDNAPWIEGSWMNKYDGKYYLQYSAPGTQAKSYSDGVYVSDYPLGPFNVAENNPFAYKPEGFACGAGHGSTFVDVYGNFWHVGTISISVKHKFERRIGFFPAFFDSEGNLYSCTKYGDYPFIIPDKKISTFDDIFPHWMLLSYKKAVTVSSALEGFNAQNINDENIRTYWSAASGGDNEWVTIDLGVASDVFAIQINFAEHDTHLYGRVKGLRYRYVVDGSMDNSKWTTVIDKSQNNSDNSHDYMQLKDKVTYRYFRIRNMEVPGGTFAISGFRIFGKGAGEKPQMVNQLNVKRNQKDKREVTLSWNKSENATGYNISYGFGENKLYQNYMVYGDTTVIIRSLNSLQKYFFTIEAFNENGITKNELIKSTKN